MSPRPFTILFILAALAGAWFTGFALAFSLYCLLRPLLPRC